MNACRSLFEKRETNKRKSDGQRDNEDVTNGVKKMLKSRILMFSLFCEVIALDEHHITLLFSRRLKNTKKKLNSYSAGLTGSHFLMVIEKVAPGTFLIQTRSIDAETFRVASTLDG